MSNYIRAKVPFMKKPRIQTAQHHEWFSLLFYKLFNHVVIDLLKKARSFVCLVCNRNHKNESELIACLRSHRVFTVDYYLENCLVRLALR